ncbi:hypothetical protein ACFO1B_53430 [Dactylosporangium siamense]|uniref:Uncharacterized protein n=1 Tax=Dactylosporangium siamense TaxID=685454 RepID=A0A919Q1P2_9ACTN|nr:hypothetical protein [Dactylosporangium siamense]GIG52763.1 hypothetical protein Dsi01nite_108040 [Dactylosporangium siamense]
MGTLRGDNGGGERPQDGGGLPDLPPEWGTIIIPDDAGALDDEGTSIRRQFRRATIRRRWRRRLHLRPEPIGRTDDDSPGLAVPLLIMSIAVIATLVSLFAVAWPRRNPNGTPQLAPSSPAAVVYLAGLSLFDPEGESVPLRELTPGVILLVDGCTCEELITGTVEAVAASRAPSTTVLVVAARIPPLPSGLNDKVKVRRLADPNSSVRAAVPFLATSRTTAAILVAADGTMIRAVSSVTSASSFDTELANLAATPSSTA